jgi:hypothetical protein
LSTTDEIDLVEREQEEVINKTPTTDEIDLVEREQKEVINKTPTTDKIDLIERVQEEGGRSFVDYLFLYSFY